MTIEMTNLLHWLEKKAEKTRREKLDNPDAATLVGYSLAIEHISEQIKKMDWLHPESEDY